MLPSLIDKHQSKTIAIENVTLEERVHYAPNPADLIRLMRDHNISRPSTYARHIANLSDLIEAGYNTRKASDRYSLT